MSVGESRWHALLDQLHATPIKIALVAAGGGSGAIAKCFRRPGASRTFLEAVIPYARASMAEYLLTSTDFRADVSLTTAIRLAERAHQRAFRLCESESERFPLAGISLTAALPTDKPRRGVDRIHVAMHGDEVRSNWSVDLGKTDFTRSMAETISDEMLFRALATFSTDLNNDTFFDQAGIVVRTEPSS